MEMTLAHPEWITLLIDGKRHYGYDQEWYPERWQKLAGCGPTTASVMMAYWEAKWEGRIIATQGQAEEKMLALWPYATPRMHGLYKTRWLREGVERYLRDHDLPGRAEMISVAPIRPFRPSLSALASFIGEGLQGDCPVGFLNLHNGGIESLYNWHWMPFVKLAETEEGWQGTVMDEGKGIDFPLHVWLKKSKFGGGFVRVVK